MDTTYRLYSSLPCPPPFGTAAEISIPALINNYRLLLGIVRDGAPGVRPICVVKADAYGHGAQIVAQALSDAGCDFFAVSCLEEAIALRSALGQRADILILGYTDPARAPEIAAHNIIQTVISRPHMAALSESAASARAVLRVHLKLDTGMNRLGIPAQSPDEINRAAECAALLAGSANLSLEGMFTHLARADEAIEDQGCLIPESGGKSGPPPSPLPDCRLSGEEFTGLQFARFRAVKTLLLERGISIKSCHVCNSAAAVRHPEYRLDCVRFGIMLYGLAPSEWLSLPGLMPVMKLRTFVSHVHNLAPGASVGYGGCFSAEAPRKIATLPVGYADGFIRAYTGGKIKIYHDGRAYPARIVGRICMDQMTADITGTPIEPGDTAILFGDEPGDLEALARHAGTIGYEALCIISSRVTRYYV